MKTEDDPDDLTPSRPERHSPADANRDPMLPRAAEEGSCQALTAVGLGDKEAVLTIHSMRSLPKGVSDLMIGTARAS